MQASSDGGAMRALSSRPVTIPHTATQVCRRVRVASVEGSYLGHAAASHERTDRVHVPHFLQLAGTDQPRGYAGRFSQRVSPCIFPLAKCLLVIELLGDT